MLEDQIQRIVDDPDMDEATREMLMMEILAQLE